MTAMGFAAGRINRQRGLGERIVSAAHSAFGWGFTILLDCAFEFSAQRIEVVNANKNACITYIKKTGFNILLRHRDQYSLHRAFHSVSSGVGLDLSVRKIANGLGASCAGSGIFSVRGE